MRRLAAAAAIAATLAMTGCSVSFLPEATRAHGILQDEYLPLIRGEKTPDDLGMTPDRIRQREDAVAQLGAAIKEAGK